MNIMKNTFVIDSYAWIEYFIGSNSGKKVKDIIENSANEIVTNIVNIAEIMSVTKRENRDFNLTYDSILNLSKVYQFNSEFVKEVGLLHAEVKQKNKHFSLGDAFVLLTAKKLNAKIVTGDEDFRNIKNVIFIK